MNYTTTEKELLAVVDALEKFRSYILGMRIIIYIDHASLKYLFSKKEAKATIDTMGAASSRVWLGDKR